MKVFLSSTAQDLVAYRHVADDTILRLSQQSVAMERFGPLPGTPVDECERLASESDVVICLVAHRYGFEPEKSRGSITRREVEAAKAAGRDVLVWIVADDCAWTEKKESDLLNDRSVTSDPDRIADVVAGVKRLQEFKAWLRATFVCDTFTTPDELGRKIAVALQLRAPTPTMPQRHGEIRIIHALQPAPHFHGREALLKELTEWVADPASPDRVWSLVAAGGTGKTAIIERVVRDMQPGEANVLVWSFYEKPEADTFLRECNHLFLGEEEGPPGGRLERLQRGLRDGRPHLIVLDGLERVQEDAGASRVRGELSDHTLKLLLRTLTAGLGRARALVTSRFPLVDLQDWENCGYRETRLDDLTPEAAVAVLRGWKVAGNDVALRSATSQVGYHALSVAVIGSYLHFFANGKIEAVTGFDLDLGRGYDPKAAKLARILAFYAERLPVDERELMARLSVFPRGVTVELLGMLVDAGGDVAGALVGASPRLLALLNSLKARGLVFAYRAATDVFWTAHPFLRETFRHLLNCPVEEVFDEVASSVGTGLDKQPETKPTDPSVLDRYERLIEATRLAGRQGQALDLFFSGMGGFRHLGSLLGELQRGYRILAAFSSTGRPEDLGQGMGVPRRTALMNETALFATYLGRLEEARAIQRAMPTSKDNPRNFAIHLMNTAAVALDLGHLIESRTLADEAVQAVDQSNEKLRGESLLRRAMAEHMLGDLTAARTDFSTGGELAEWSWTRIGQARQYLDLGQLVLARSLCTDIRQSVVQHDQRILGAFCDVIDGRLDLADGADPTERIESLRAWTSQSGDTTHIIEAHALQARHLLALGNFQAALDEAETGLLHAESCGYGLRRIELLVTIAAIRLAWPDPQRAIQAAREALDLATHPDCQYAWGEADAAQVWGEAYFANHEPELAHRAFTRALAVRKRIEHPGIAKTEKWLAMTGL